MKKLSDKRIGRHSRQSGFALVITLASLAFLVVIVLSMVNMMSISTTVGRFQQENDRIREMAMAAALRGLAQLQYTMGPDTSISTTATSLVASADAADELPGVYGLWGYTTYARRGGGDFWLYDTPSDNDLTRDVRKEIVPGVSVTLRRGNPAMNRSDTGVYYSTYWISDEGVKASMQSFENAFTDPDEQLRLAGWQSPDVLVPLHNISVSGMGGGYDRNQLLMMDPAYKTGGFSYYDTVYTLSDAAQRKELLERVFHNVTMNHTALLTNPVDGGLKEDRNALALAYPGLGEWMQTTEAVVAPPFTDEEGEHNVSIAPILTSFRLQYSVTWDTGMNRWVLRQRFSTRLWNPYTTPLIMPANGIDIVVRGLPDILVTRNAKDGDGNDLPPQLFPIRISELDMLSSGNLVFNLQLGSNVEWLPGRVFHWAGMNSGNGEARFGARSMVEYVTDFPLPPSLPAYDSSNSATYEVAFGVLDATTNLDGGSLSITVRANEGATSEDLYTISGIEYDDVGAFPIDVDDLASPGSNVSEDEGGSVGTAESQIGFYVRLYEPKDGGGTSGANKGVWLSKTDFRNPVHVASEGADDEFNYHYSGIRDGNSRSPKVGLDGPDVGRLQTRPLSGPNADLALMDFPLYELALNPPMSVAALQHVPIVGERPSSIGNPWGGEYNVLFDQYYMDLNTNPQNKRYKQVNGDRLVVDGAFNVNSKSEEAWESVLHRGLIQNWTYPTKNDSGEISDDATTILVNPFARFVQSAYSTFYTGPKTGAANTSGIPPREFFVRGVREFTDEQIKELAKAIVAEIKAYHSETGQGRPFVSMQEFVNSGVIERAISSAGLNSMEAIEDLWGSTDGAHIEDRDDPSGQSFINGDFDEFNYDEIWQYSPFYLTQADVLAAIDPFLTVRSDTFVIRGYAEERFYELDRNKAIVDPTPTSVTGSIVASAMVELLVQRTYDLHPDYPSTENNRRFRIIGIRWLK
jgi:hypothetical protein